MFKRFHFLAALAAVAAFVSFTGCGDGGAAAPNTATLSQMKGEVVDHVYTNELFGMSLPLPADWHLAPQESQDDMMDLGNELISGDDATMKRQLDAAAQASVVAFMVTKEPIGSPVVYNPNLNCAVESIKHMPGIKSGSDYLFHVKKILLNGAIPYTVDDEYQFVDIGGRTFTVMHGSMDILQMLIEQDMYVLVEDGYACVLSASYLKDAERDELLAILNQMTFDKPAE